MNIPASVQSWVNEIAQVTALSASTFAMVPKQKIAACSTK